MIAILLLVSGGMASGAISFNRDVRPILSDACYACHGPDKNTRMAGLRLDLREDFRHPVHIGLATDEADVRKGLCLRGEMLAAAETDFEPDLVERPVEDFAELRRRGH